MYHTGQTIKETLDQIQRHKLVLPAIQREFVWRPEQIYRLFDSLMQGYPFGTFLYWKASPENSEKFNFYDFVLNYHKRDNSHCPALPQMPKQELTVVLDGQQRLTALNIGLRGSIAWKQPYLWHNNPNAFPIRQLYLDLLWRPDENKEDGLKYRFSFRTEEEPQTEGECWFPVKDILSMDGGPPIVRWLNKQLPQKQVDSAYKTLDRLHRVVHQEPIVAYYEEKKQELDKVLQIFIRMNDGGTPLSHSDLLLSIAVAQWTKHDAREEIHRLVDELNRIGVGFSFSKDLVLKAGLMLSDIGSVGFKVDNFNRSHMNVFEDKWNDIKRALTLTVQLISGFGFSGQTLSAHNAILPIAYYIYHKNPGETYLTNGRFSEDRRTIGEWLIRSLLKSGVWGSGLDTLLTALRRVVRQSDSDVFPVTQIGEEMARQGKSLVFEDGEIEDLADMRYGDRLTFALLSLLFPSVNLRNHFHVDHIFPSSRFTLRALNDAGVPDDKRITFWIQSNGLANLQLLPGPDNNEKKAMMPSEWLSKNYENPPSRRQYQEHHLLGEVPDSITEFDAFYAARRERLKEKIKKLLGR